MNAKRARFLAGMTIAAGLLAATWVTPAAAAGCTVTAPATVKVGTGLNIVGTGFPSSGAVAIDLSVEGGPSDQFSVQTDAAGRFEINLTPEPADIGKTTVVATAGSTCTAQITFTVLGVNQTAAPTAEPTGSGADASGEPTATAEPTGSAADASGEPTATAEPTGSGADASGEPPPRTDAAWELAAGQAGLGRNAWLLAILALVIGVGGLIGTRSTRSR